MQIRNFSAAGLRAFGRTLASLPGEALFPCVLHRSFAAQSPVERCVCSGPVVLDYASGMSLLVLFGQAEPLFFYLDRIVQLEPGVEFAVAALSETCAVDICPPGTRCASCPPSLPPRSSRPRPTCASSGFIPSSIRNAAAIFIFAANGTRRMSWSMWIAGSCTIWSVAATFCSASSSLL